MRTNPTTSEEKKNYLEKHFTYEMEMLIFSCEFLKREATDQMRINLGLENFLLHGRSLLEFFYYDPHDKYLRAINFIPKFKQIRPEKTLNLCELERRASDEIIHLGYLRIDRTDIVKQWNWGKTLVDFLAVGKVFLDHLSNEYFGEKMETIKRSIDTIFANQNND